MRGEPDSGRPSGRPAASSSRCCGRGSGRSTQSTRWPPPATATAIPVTRKKSDPGDALVLANILRTDTHAHWPLPQDSDLARAIVVLARAQQDAVWNRQQMSNQLRSLLREYFPAALDAYLHWQNGPCRPEARILLELAPTPARAARLSLAQLRSALKRAGRQRRIGH
ncbi:hypothetical protein C5746_12830 [Streptomyces atratus]|uniref:Transposase IS110-like N-terminal domain-containing protein n=1 Tax=Streptomyces atratus TaxID=1893 RepID=A0A2Z5JBE4_STRAR|nr:hypothetical protein C5746_12830 [Streptomyces atratus]